MAFDPDAYLQKANVPAGKPSVFDPDSYIAKASGQKPQDAASVDKPGEAALQGFGQAASFGYLPQLQAATEPLTDKLFSAIEGKDAPDDQSTYVQRRDRNIKEQEQLAKDNPKSYIGGLLGGSVASGGALAKALPASVAAMSPLKQAAIAGGAQGLLSNPGDVQGEISGPQLEDRAKGGALGAVVGGAAEKAVGAIQGAPASLKSFAQEKAFKSSGSMLKDFRAAFARDNVHELGQYMIDNGLVKPGMTFEDVASRSQTLKQETGKKIGEFYDRLADAAAKNPAPIASSFAIAAPDTIRAELIAATRNNKVLPKLDAPQYTEAMDKIIDQISKGPTHDVRFLNDIIGELDGKINWAQRTPEMAPMQQGLVALRRTLRQKVNDIADRLSGVDQAASEHLKMLNRDYGAATTINRISTDRVGRESANRILSPSDYGAAGIGALIGSQFGSTPEERLKHAIYGAGAGLANKGMRRYGNPALVQGANAASKVLKPISNIPFNAGVIGSASGNIANQLRK